MHFLQSKSSFTLKSKKTSLTLVNLNFPDDLMFYLLASGHMHEVHFLNWSWLGLRKEEHPVLQNLKMVTMKTLVLRHHHHHTNQYVTSWLSFCSVSDKNALTVQHYCKASQRSHNTAVDCMFLDDCTKFFSPNALLIQYICRYNVVIEHRLSFFLTYLNVSLAGILCDDSWHRIWFENESERSVQL